MDQSTEDLNFLWEKFITEKKGAIQQIIGFTEGIIFYECLEDILDLDEIHYLYVVDTELRMKNEIPKLGWLEDITIYIE